MGTDFGPIKPVRGFLKIIFIIIMIMVAIYIFFQPVWNKLMEIVTGG
jgi:hypothetical protein